ncbi:hypothetical protein L1049_002660 [Liquidambar formosana]|uniref:Uncharacterized protein n=1 Tax=Liquidambar formosana TaxID=63359 RepID=A0AAP0NKD0_LIQFO
MKRTHLELSGVPSIIHLHKKTLGEDQRDQLSRKSPLLSPHPFIHSESPTMEPKSTYINGSRKAETNSLWKWKGSINNRKKNQEKQFPVPGFLRDSHRKTEEAVLGPGCGAGIGCGVGLGLGLVGGVGYGGWPWNHLRLVFGVGMVCGVGFGFGYGQGIGYGFSLDSLKSRVSKQSSDSKKRIVIEI